MKRERVTARPPRSTRRHTAAGAAKITDWIQALSAVIAAVTAAWAVIVALDTLRDQQKINASQYELNRLAQQRVEERYATRVSWWGSYNSADIYIQNRSPALLRSTEIRYARTVNSGLKTLQVAAIGSIPPCVTIIVNYSDLEPHWMEQNHDVSLSLLALAFTDPNGRWSRDIKGPLSAQGSSTPTGTVPVPPRVWKRQPVQDCGEGG